MGGQRSLIPCAPSSQTAGGSGCCPLSNIVVPAGCFLSITSLPKFRQQPPLFVTSDPSLMTSHYCWSWGILLSCFVGSLSLAYALGNSPFIELFSYPPSVCHQLPARTLPVFTWSLGEHPLLVLLEASMLMLSLHSLPLRC